MDKPLIVVWFSCGAASAVAAKKTIEKYGDAFEVRVVNNPIYEEDSDNMRFLKDVEKWIGQPIYFATHPNYNKPSVVQVWDDVRFMSHPKGAPCTRILKKEARYCYELKNIIAYHVLGFTLDEKDRYDKFVKRERANTIGVLIDEGISKQDCFDILAGEGIEIPMMYKLGYPNANCPGCVKATSPTYWNHVRKVHPEVFKQRAEQSRRIGAKLVRYKGKRIFLDELPEDAIGKPMKNFKIECGIFCDTQ